MKAAGILAMIEKMQMPFVYIYEGQRVSTNDQAAFATSDCVANPEDLTAELAVKLVEDFFSYATPGVYTAKMKKQERSTNSMRKIRFEIEGANVQGIASPAQQDLVGITKALEDKFTAQMAEFKRQMEVDRLKEENKLLEQQLEASKGYEPKLNFLIEGLAERYFIGPKSQRPQPKVSGSHTQQNSEASAQAQDIEKRVNDAVRNVAEKVQGDTAPLMEKLAELTPTELTRLASLDPAMIRFAISKLNGHSHESADN